jgi:hypothetical protein
MSNWGLKVALPGYDVHTATPEQCAIHSSYPSPKVKIDATPRHYGTIRITFNNNPPSGTTTTLYTVAHGYNYTPMALAAGTFSDFMSEMDGTLPLEPTATLEIFIETDDTNMYLKMYYESGFGSIIGNKLTVSYQIFAENGL